MPWTKGRAVRGSTAGWLLVVASSVIASSAMISPVSAADPATPPSPSEEGEREPAGGRRSRLDPPDPQATPDELLAYVEKISDPAMEPDSRGRQRYHRRRVASLTIQAAEAILAQAPASDPRRARAIVLKLDALGNLKELGEPRVAEALAAFAESLADDPDPAVAARAGRLALEARVDAVLSGNSPGDAVPLVRRIAALLDEAPDDPALLAVAGDLASRLERVPGGDDAARLALESFLPRFERSGDQRLQAVAHAAAGTLRRLSLPGRPIELEGTLLDGSPFDPASLAGKVVLVDFWATWCGPCVAEIPRVRELYDRYHDRGFEVVGVSLDEDRDALDAFVTEREIPWPIILDQPPEDGGKSLLAARYGITGIPTMILVGADGNVVSIEARGRRLDELLAEAFPDEERP